MLGIDLTSIGLLPVPAGMNSALSIARVDGHHRACTHSTNPEPLPGLKKNRAGGGGVEKGTGGGPLVKESHGPGSYTPHRTPANFLYQKSRINIRSATSRCRLLLS